MTQKKSTDILRYRRKGWLALGKSRMMLIDVLQGFYNLRKAIKTEVGENANYVIFQAGIKGAFSFAVPMFRAGSVSPGHEGFVWFLSELTRGGCGDLHVSELDWQNGLTRIRCPDTFESWAYLSKRSRIHGPSCDYLRGLVLGFMKATHFHAETGLEGQLDCVEISCRAMGQDHCEFITGNQEKLKSLGHQPSMPRQSIRQELKQRVTEKTRKIQEANRSTERILKNAPVGILTLDSAGGITSANRAIAKIMGTSCKNLIGAPLLSRRSIFPPELIEHFEKALEGKKFELTGYPIKARDERFVAVKGIPLKDTHGRIEGCLCIMENTTQQTLNSHRIEYLKNYNENIIHSITEGIMVIDPAFKINLWNPKMEEIFNVKASRVLQKTLGEISRFVIGSEIFKWIADEIHKGSPVERKRVPLYTQSRGLVILNLKIIPFFDKTGSITGTIILHEDVTESERNEVRYQNLFEVAQDGICLTDREGCVISANRKILQTLEIDWDRLKGTFLENYLRLDKKSQLKEMVSQVIKGSEVEPHELELISMSGKRIPVEISITAIRDEGRIFGFHMICRDIAKRKQMETQMIQASKLAAVGELASRVAHEINNPLASVAGYAEDMLDRIHEGEHVSTKDIQEFEENLNIVIEQAHRCKGITQNLLDFARQEEFDIIPSRINQLIEKTIFLIEPELKHRKIKIFMDLEPNLSFAETSPPQLQQVFLNILKNGVDAVGTKGMIRVFSSYENGNIKIRFQDNGPGIPDKNLEKIFNPFFTTKPSGQGTGLGLSICYRIMQTLKGTIGVKNQIGGGCMFTVSVPEKWHDIPEPQERLK